MAMSKFILSWRKGKLYNFQTCLLIVSQKINIWERTLKENYTLLNRDNAYQHPLEIQKMISVFEKIHGIVLQDAKLNPRVIEKQKFVLIL